MKRFSAFRQCRRLLRLRMVDSCSGEGSERVSAGWQDVTCAVSRRHCRHTYRLRFRLAVHQLSTGYDTTRAQL